MKIKPLWNKLKEYAKRHVFHMVMLGAIIVLGFMQFSQYVITASMYGIISMDQNSFQEYKIQMEEARSNDLKSIHKHIEDFYQKSNKILEESKMELNSRIDILDSAIKPEEKRRMLITKVRDAIVENTDTKLTIRDLNNISIAVIDYSFQYNLSISRVLAQMKAESDFIITAKSRAKAQGLMQIIPETWDYVELKEFDNKRLDPYNIYHNIKVGCFYMSEQVHKFDSYDQALMAYNWGPHRVRQLLAGEISQEEIPSETKKYVKIINGYIKVFESYGLE